MKFQKWILLNGIKGVRAANSFFSQFYPFYLNFEIKIDIYYACFLCHFIFIKFANHGLLDYE